jgi:hypothetical protein
VDEFIQESGLERSLTNNQKPKELKRKSLLVSFIQTATPKQKSGKIMKGKGNCFDQSHKKNKRRSC